MIHESIQKYIEQIAGQSSRAIRATLGRKNSRMPIQIISIYAPRNGHTEGGRRKHWKGVNEILNKTRKRHMIIWLAGTNGKLGRDEVAGEPNTNKDNAATKIVGPYKRATKTEKANGKHLQRIYREPRMAPTITWKQPRLANHDRCKSTNNERT